MCINFKIRKKTFFDLTHESLSCAKQDLNTKLLALGTTEGCLKIAKIQNNNTVLANKFVQNLQINSVDWLANGLVCMSLDLHGLALYDPMKNKLAFRQLYDENIRHMRAVSNNEILCWYRDGMAILVDLRSKTKQLEFKSKDSVTCANINTQNRNIIYTTSIPGTQLNIWDMRYTKRGKYISMSKQISNTHTCDLEMIDGLLFATDNQSNVFRISAGGNFKSKIIEGDGQGRAGRLHANDFFKTAFFTTQNAIYSINNKAIKMYDSNMPLIGCTGSKDDLFVYSTKRIVNFVISPNLFLNHK
ncbi:hypothetical protein NGRA_1847 [Nosema granulosis]|uniref:Uncharacterized protein n=1 Tax=Nosema granulosis TaxID=83296 RepID=A0A9P6GZ96_9MICR|nr:hypothetical protein NGRA_1847 [Nosema granulosis]